MQQLSVQYLSVKDIHPYSNNPRDNTQAVKGVMASIQAFGFINPIVVDGGGTIVCGHTRYEAALRLGLQMVPTVDTGDLTEEQINAFRLVDNKTAQLAIWDIPLLDASMQLIESMEGQEIDMSDFGFVQIPWELEDAEQEELEQKEQKKEPADDGKCCCPACGFRFKPKKGK